MKLRTALLAIVLLLLAGSFAVAGAAPAPPVQDSPLCLANASQTGLAAGHPVVLATAQPCGACSDSWCQGRTLGAMCRTGYICQNIYGNFCPQDSRPVCTCSNWSPF